VPLRHLRDRLPGGHVGRDDGPASGSRPWRDHAAQALAWRPADATRLLQQRFPQPVPPRLAAERHKRCARFVEPTAHAEQTRIATIRETAPDLYKFQAECTPGYYNNKGKPHARSQAYGGGAVAFHGLLRRWREHGGMDDVLAV
jgi:hypothetical protein